MKSIKEIGTLRLKQYYYEDHFYEGRKIDLVRYIDPKITPMASDFALLNEMVE